MIFKETALSGAFVIDPEPQEDARGLFARTWCWRELQARGLETRTAQCSTSFNRRKGTLRGLHYQRPPAAETKIVRCTRGALYDVIIDLRPESPTFLEHVAVVLTADNRRMLYVPTGFAHGFQTLEDDTEVFYQISEFSAPEHARGVRWNDPLFGISWPIVDRRTIIERDQRYPDFRPVEVGAR
ncbi:MAG: dTDP-4-dehydrorhamnose 3,5-epimerase [Gammaproteobacteria bacterium]